MVDIVDDIPFFWHIKFETTEGTIDFDSSAVADDFGFVEVGFDGAEVALEEGVLEVVSVDVFDGFAEAGAGVDFLAVGMVFDASMLVVSAAFWGFVIVVRIRRSPVAAMELFVVIIVAVMEEDAKADGE